MSNKLKKARRTKHSGPKFIQLFRYVLDCPAYVSLSLGARAALIELNLGYNGSNNGKIVFSVRQLAERMGCDKDFANRALQELTEKGFIEPRVKGAFSVKFRRATEWRLNDRRCDATGQEQSQAFLKWEPAPNDPAKSKTRSVHRGPCGPSRTDTRNFLGGSQRSLHNGHSETFTVRPQGTLLHLPGLRTRMRHL